MGPSVCNKDFVNSEVKFYDNLSNEFGFLVGQFRVRKNISQDKLAERIGVSPRTMRRIEAGEKKNPSIQLVMAICIALNLDASDCIFFIKRCRLWGYFDVLDQETVIYMKIISAEEKGTVWEWNEVLIDNGCTPLAMDKDKATED